MKRRFGKITLFLLLGAILNIALVWGYAYFGFPDISESEEVSQSEAEAIVFPNSAPRNHRGEINVSQYHGYGFVCTEVATKWLIPDPKGMKMSQWAGTTDTAHARGWPMLSLIGWTRLNIAGVGRGEWAVVWTESKRGSQANVLPYKPIWPGFAINTIFYATFLWLLLVAPLALRRQRCIKRGLCPACKYPVGKSAICTECGRPVAPRKIVTT